MNNIAFELLERFGDRPTRQLVLEASSRKNKPGHRLRALHALARTKALADPNSFMDIFLLLRDPNAEIRTEAATLIEFARRRRLGSALPANADRKVLNAVQ
jgi:hypothetical protein